MTRIIHAADLHLREAEKDYCFAVLDELLSLAKNEKADYLLFCGDLFDSFADLKALKDVFRAKVEALKGCAVIYLPGNHEELRRGTSDNLAAYDLGPVTKCLNKPYSIINGSDVEFICVPHQESYAGYRDWGVPAKVAGKARVLLLHGTDSSVYCGPEAEESKGGIIDEDMFSVVKADYAAMGHIHGKAQKRINGCLICYSGSAGVWRAGETGPRGVFVLEAAGGAVREIEFKEIKSAGEYRFVSSPLGLDGGADLAELKGQAREWGKQDFVEVGFSGFVEDENAVAGAEEAVRAAFGSKVRRLDIVRGEIVVAAGIAAHPAAKSFIEKWRARKPQDAAREKTWLLARAIGLKAIAEALK